MKLSIVPVGYIKRELLESLGKYLESVGFHVTISDELPVPERAYSKELNQYLVNPFFDLMKNPKAHHLIITDVDLCSPPFLSIFGFNQGKNVIVSIFRLKGDLVKERTLKVAIHGLGHMLSILHCSDPQCVMSYSKNVTDIDYKHRGFCKKCQKLWPL